MDIIRLGEYNNVNPTYLPDRMVEGFTSKIWTERYLTPGDFEFKTFYVDEMLEILPLKTFISHRHTKEVMQVETHSIATDEFGVEELTIKGRSVDAILESRFVEGPYGKRRKMNRSYTPGGAALVMMWNVLDNDATVDSAPYDVTRIRKDGGPDEDDEGEGERWPWNVKDKLPNVAISDSATTATGDLRKWWLKEGMLYDQLIRVLNQGDLGIRTIRPPSATLDNKGAPDGLEGERVWIHSNLSEFGLVERVDDSNYPELRFDVYKGLNRRQGNGTNPVVIFNARRDHFAAAQHLYSIAEWKTAMEVMSSLNRKWDIYRAGQSGWDGWDRRVMTMDAGSPDIPDEPEEPKRKNYSSDAAFNTAHNKWEEKHDKWLVRRGNIIDQFEDDYKKDGKKELNTKKRVYLFSGDVDDSLITQKYKVNYNLGDKVTLKGRNGIVEGAIVAEHVLTEDLTGQRSYPGLDLLEEV